MKIISLFNNKGGVGKTTLAYHLSCALSDLGKKTLMIDLDPQCNLTICALTEGQLDSIWKKEDPFIDDYSSAMKINSRILPKMLSEPRTIHFLLKPVEDGISDSEVSLPPPINCFDNLDLIPGRLTIHMFENKLAERWSGVYQGDPLSLRTVTQIRAICEKYAKDLNYEYIIIDTSPSLGILNKTIISTVDGFIVPCQPDMFSLYGIRNIGNSLTKWKTEFSTIFQLISDKKREYFPENFVKFIGYTIYNAKKAAKSRNDWDLSQAQFNFAKDIPDKVFDFIPESTRINISKVKLKEPIGGTSIMHSHNTLPNMAQKYKLPIWSIPSYDNLDAIDASTIRGNRKTYEGKKDDYLTFTHDLLKRLEHV